MHRSIRGSRPPAGGRLGRALLLVGSFTLLNVLSLGCRDLVGTATLPPGTQSPSTYNTPEGALGLYQGVNARLGTDMRFVLLESGVLTDELASTARGSNPASIGATGNPIDERTLPETPTGSSGTSYSVLQDLRGQAREAMGLLKTYAPATSPALRGELYTLTGYAEVLLAELYCNGVPLSTLDFQGDFTYQPSSTAAQVYQHAVMLLDSALVLSGDSARVTWWARVEKGRALLELGHYAEAAQAVQTVPDTFRYQVVPQDQWTNIWGSSFVTTSYTVADREGENGLPYVSGGDPRVSVNPTGTNQFGLALFAPAQYPPESTAPIVLASGVEARLIQAEAALRAGDVTTWLTSLNQLRTSGSMAVPADTIADTLGVTDCGSNGYGLCGTSDQQFSPAGGQPAGGFPVPAGYSFAYADTTYPAPAGMQDYCNSNSWYEPCYGGDSMVVLHYVRPTSPPQWSAGTGGVAGLAPLTDPGTDSARVSLLFRERAYWLFLTGHRQGDLRRLVRAPSAGGYGRPQQQIYPTGPYFGGLGAYGGDVALPIPYAEHANPLFHGCLDRGA